LIARDFSFNEGLVMRAVRDALIIAPPLVITREQADTLIGIVGRVLDLTLGEVDRLALAA
jgi:putrescine aminotransferase